jgi:hypothetical protein
MEENDYKNLLGTYQKKSMDLFTQIVALETKNEILEKKLRESNELILKLTERINELTQEKEEHY